MKNLLLLLPLLFLLTLLSCTPSPRPVEAPQVPAWTQDAIWYQIFVERFRNGDTLNDPTPNDMLGGYPAYIPPSWKITPWGHDWYAPEPWHDDCKVEGFYARIQMRRFGGDLQGVLDKVDYIQALGVNAVYFNPLNDSPSMHKYDARNYTHIDRNFGPDPYADEILMDSETPWDPNTWHWTQADKLFLKVIEAFHQRGIRVILDYSWNHTGPPFWAMQDIRENGAASQFADWYHIKKYDDPATPEDEFDYEGWAGYKGMPVFNKTITPPEDKEMPFEGNLTSESLKQHIFDVSRRWLDPNGDGNPSDGIDGFRLDVAGEIPMGFWREYRQVVRAVNPEAYLLGEIWWLDWPDSLLDPKPFLEGDQFDAVMNYRWYKLARGLFAQAEPALKPSQFAHEIEAINHGIRPEYLGAMMNMSASHDTERLSTSLYNKTRYKFEAKPGDNPDYKIEKPDARTLAEQKLFLLHQFTYLGAPQIWNGDEVGMWGADDPDCRKPMVWDDLSYEVERAHFVAGKERPADTVRVDHQLLAYYKSLSAFRKDHPVLARGKLQFLLADDENNTLAYRRSAPEEELVVVFNISEKPVSVTISTEKGVAYEEVFGGKEPGRKFEHGALQLEVGPMQGVVLKRMQ
ncbi:MAG: alpha-glucosidase C-terminal domain-containing protein [Saprospirales bacterium]|nr:alpha-glucosidase C-terminal domain-containing protein [Saprospirales bacterium]